MKLERLLKKITLPIYPERDMETGKLRLRSKNNAGDGYNLVITDAIQSTEIAQYLGHAANVLPELLAAAKNLRENWEHHLTEPMARVNEAIGHRAQVIL